MLLGLHLYEPASGVSLEHDAGDGAQALAASPLRTWSLRLIGWFWAAYGTFAFRHRGVSLYLLLRSHFVFYDYTEPVLIFLIDYLSVMVMFVLIGYLISMLLKWLPTFCLH